MVAAARVLVRTLIVMNELSRQGIDYPRHEDGVIIATAGSAVGLELISLAWPSYQLEARRASDVRVSVDGERSFTPTLLQDLSAVAVRDFEETKPTLIASRAVTSATERADTRNWSMLPAELLLARFHLPPGQHTLRISFEGLHGSRHLLEIDVEIRGGEVTTHTVAVLGDDSGNKDRFRTAAQGVHYVAPAVPDITAGSEVAGHRRLRD